MFELIPSLVNAGIGLWETLGSQKGIDELNSTPEPNYSVSPELQGAYNTAQLNATRGFAPEQAAAFRANVAKNINTKTKRATDASGGNLAKVISGIGNINTEDAENKFATQDAMLKDEHLKYADVLANQIQHQKNLKTQTDIHHRLLMEQAYGQGKKTGVENIGSAINFGALMLSGKGKGAGAGGPDLSSFFSKPNPFSVKSTLGQPDMTGAPQKPSLEDFMGENVSPFTDPGEDVSNYPYKLNSMLSVE